MKTHLLSLFVLSGVVVTAGCDGGIKEAGGAILGGAAGGAIGTQVGGGRGQTAAIIAGTIIGALMGGSVGRSLDRGDEMYAAQALESQPSGQPVRWVNPDSKVAYSFTPSQTYYQGNLPCREFTSTAIIDGRQETVYGRACRQADGTWATMPK